MLVVIFRLASEAGKLSQTRRFYSVCLLENILKEVLMLLCLNVCAPISGNDAGSSACKEIKRRFEPSSGSLWFLERDSARLEVTAHVPSSCLDIAEACSKSTLILFCISTTCKIIRLGCTMCKNGIIN